MMHLVRFLSDSRPAETFDHMQIRHAAKCVQSVTRAPVLYNYYYNIILT